VNSLSGKISDVVKMFQLKHDFSTFLYVVSTIFLVCTLCYHQKLPIGLEVVICGDASSLPLVASGKKEKVESSVRVVTRS
jgi:hypothetical protein